MKLQCPDCSEVSEFPRDQLVLASQASFVCPGCKAQIKLDQALIKDENSESSPPGTKQSRNSKGSLPSSKSKQSRGQALRDRILRTVGDLPPMPQVVHKAREVMAKPDSSFKDLAVVIIADQAIAAKVLKLSNSALYGLSGRVSSIQHASVVLGQKTLAEILTLACFSKLMGKTLKGYGLEAGQLWQHSLAVGFGARLVAKKKHPVLTDDAFSAGLIHDAGKLVLDKYILERRKDIEQFMANGGESFLAAEKEIFGFDHAEIAAEVCKAWKVPEHLTTAISCHHCPYRSKDNPLGYIIHVADAIAMKSGLGARPDALSHEIDSRVTGFLGLEKQDIDSAVAGVTSSVQNIMEELSGE